MFTFEIGWLSFALAVICPALYLIGYVLRKTGAWMTGEAQPKHKVGVFVVLFFVLGFIFGSLLQPKWDYAKECKAAGSNYMQCFLFPNLK